MEGVNMKRLSTIVLVGISALSGCAIVSTPNQAVAPAPQNVIVRVAPPAPDLSAIALHQRDGVTYAQFVGNICAHAVREKRVQEESRLMKAAGKPVAMATGTCEFILTVTSTGEIKSVHPSRCTTDNEDLSTIMQKAVLSTSPLPPPIPNGAVANIRLVLAAPVATPGVLGN